MRSWELVHTLGPIHPRDYIVRVPTKEDEAVLMCVETIAVSSSGIVGGKNFGAYMSLAV